MESKLKRHLPAIKREYDDEVSLQVSHISDCCRLVCIPKQQLHILRPRYCYRAYLRSPPSISAHARFVLSGPAVPGQDAARSHRDALLATRGAQAASARVRVAHTSTAATSGAVAADAARCRCQLDAITSSLFGKSLNDNTFLDIVLCDILLFHDLLCYIFSIP